MNLFLECYCKLYSYMENYVLREFSLTWIKFCKSRKFWLLMQNLILAKITGKRLSHEIYETSFSQKFLNRKKQFSLKLAMLYQTEYSRIHQVKLFNGCLSQNITWSILEYFVPYLLMCLDANSLIRKIELTNLRMLL